MKTSGIHKGIFILRAINRLNAVDCHRQIGLFKPTFSSSVAGRNVTHDPSKGNPSQRNNNFNTAEQASCRDNLRRKFNKRSQNKADPELRKLIPTSRLNPDNFGTLSNDWALKQQMCSMPDEEDEFVEKEFLDNREGKTRLTVNQYGYIIKKFIRQRKIGNAIEVLETRMLKEDRAKPENYIFNLLIGACGEVGYTKKAFALYNQMKQRGLKVTGHAYTGLFNACANSPFPEDGLRHAKKLREMLVEKAVLMNHKIYHSMIKAYGRCGDLETAFLLVDEMIEKKIAPSEETFNFLLQSCATDKAAGFRHALLVWWKMKQKNITPDLFTFNLLLRCCRDCGLGEEQATQSTIQVLLHSNKKQSTRPLISQPPGHMEGTGVAVTHSGESTPNLICAHPTMGNVVAMHSITSSEHRLMLMGGSKGILEQMKFYKVKPDIKTFSQLLDQIPPTLSAEQELLETMKQEKISLDIDFCNMLIKKRCLRRDYENAKSVLKLIQGENLSPDIVTFGVLAMTCQSLTCAQGLVRDIKQFSYRVNVEILGTLLKNACFARDCDFVMEVMETMKKEELKPNDKFLMHLDNFFRFTRDALSKEVTDDTGRLTRGKFQTYCSYYQSWKKDMSLKDPPHPWSQFQTLHSEPEDLETMNIGKVKYAKVKYAK